MCFLGTEAGRYPPNKLIVGVKRKQGKHAKNSGYQAHTIGRANTIPRVREPVRVCSLQLL